MFDVSSWLRLGFLDELRRVLGEAFSRTRREGRDGTEMGQQEGTWPDICRQGLQISWLRTGSTMSLYEPARPLPKSQLIGYTRDSVLMDSVVFYQPQLATVPNFNSKLVRPLAAARDYGDDSSDDDDFPPLSELLPKRRGDSAAAKLSLRSMTENAVDYTLDGNPASPFEPRVCGSQG
jgi:hypothetical protein